jgi:predicted lipid-binding transport protein (Tim44 family)
MIAIRKPVSNVASWSGRPAALAAFVAFAALVGSLASSAAVAQDRLYRCGTLYTNADKSADPACIRINMDRITVVPAQPQESKPAAQAKPVAAQSSSRAATRVSSLAQTQKDSDSRQILEAEWRKTRQRLQDLQSEYNQGEPERLGSERNNPQKYLDRVAALQSSIARLEADLTGIRRELARMGAVVQP